MKKVLLPIYLKLVVFVLIIVAISLSAYVYYSVSLFQNDKVSYVFEAVDDHNVKLIDKAKLKIESIGEKLSLFSSSNYSSSFIHTWLRSNPNILYYFEFEDQKLSKVVTFLENKNVLSDFDLTNFESEQKGIVEHNDNFLFYNKVSKLIFGVVVNRNYLLDQSLTGLFQDLYLTKSSLNTLKNFDQKIVGYIKSKNKEGQTFLFQDNDKWIVSYRELNQDFSILTKASFAKAIAASATLRENSLYFGLLVAGIVIIGVLIFSKFLTVPITKLLGTVKGFLQSDFQNRAKISTRDEIGVLATSFNQMADDIEKYMSEMKDKIRLEEELKTANIVQSQFFPKKHYPLVCGNIYGFYQSASECGGDWWGVYESGPTTILILADVTGHGTPAALLTAILFNTINSIDYLAKSDSSYLTDPRLIMSYMNNSIAKASNQLNATAFVLCLDHKTKSIRYSNASHNPPLYFPIHRGEVGKGDLVPLMDNNGPRLGENKNQEYEFSTIELGDKDKIIFYTDGLTEAENQEGKQYGQRKLIKSLLEKQSLPVNDIIEQALTEFKDFTQGTELMDDITFVGLEIN